MLDFSRLVRSFRYAFRGVSHVFREEQSFRTQIVVALIVLILALFFHVKIWEAVALILVIIMVLVLELINSIFERIVDVLKPRMHPYVEAIKDMMSATVLLASLGAAIVGILIFYPYLAKIFK